MTGLIFDAIYNLVFVFLGIFYFDAFLDLKSRKGILSRYIIPTCIWFVAVCTISWVFNEAFILKIVLAVTCSIVFAITNYKVVSWVRSIVIGIMYYGITITSDFVLYALLRVISPDMKIIEVLESSLYGYSGTISLLLQLLIILALRRLIGKDKSADISKRDWIGFSVFPVSSIVLLLLLIYGFDGKITNMQSRILVIIAFFILILNIFVYLVLRIEIRRSLELQQNRLDLIHAKEITHLYHQLTTERDILGKREHEYKNIINVMTKLACDNEYARVKEILLNQNTELINNTNIVETGNKIINSVLNAKYYEARDNGIKFTFELDDLSEVYIDSTDLIVILSNAFNNAIEACQKCEIPNRKIHTKLVVEDGQLVFSIKNSASIKITTNAIIKSNKDDVIRHGYGLTNIKDTVSKRDGLMTIDSSTDSFTLTVILPL